MVEQLKNQQLALLARKALLQDELKQIEDAIRQIGAVVQFAEQQAAQVAPQEPAPAE